MKNGVDMRVYIREQCDLANLYAEDGAYASAGRILTRLAAEVNQHAVNVAQMERNDRDERT